MLDKELATLYMLHPGERTVLPDDDAPFVWAPGVQLACDFDVADVNAAYIDPKEATVRGRVEWGGGRVPGAQPFPSAAQLSLSDASLSAPAPAKQRLTLADCLERSAQREQLGEHDMWYCRKCTKHVQARVCQQQAWAAHIPPPACPPEPPLASPPPPPARLGAAQAFKKMDLWRLPPVLILHLKRFQYERGIYGLGHVRSKIEELVEFPVDGLDLSGFAAGPQAEPPVYDLFAVSDHSGGLGGGHYTAHARNFADGRWYYFNDSSVAPCLPASAVRSSAYILFYRRRAPGAAAPAPAAAAAGGGAALGSALPPGGEATSAPEDQIMDDS